MTTKPEEIAVLHQWTARKMQPVILLYVALVFVAFMVMAHFVFHSPAAVRALAVTMAGSVLSLAPGVLGRTEFRMVEAGLQKRPFKPDQPGDFQDVFRWSEVERVKPTGQGFKFYRALDESRKARRFWKLHVSDACSGEFLVEAADRPRVASLLADNGLLR